MNTNRRRVREALNALLAFWGIKVEASTSLPDKLEAKRFISALYRGILRREPNIGELEAFIAAFLSGRTPGSIAEQFVESDEFKLATAVRMFVPPGHFYSPVVNPTVADSHLRHLETSKTPESISGIRLDRSGMRNVWQSLLPFMKDIPFQETKTSNLNYAFVNPFYSWGDGSVLHAMLRLHQPKRLIEIGSGWSSACALDTIDKYLNNTCEVTCVEPFPELLHELTGAFAGRIQLLKKPVQHVPLNTFEALSSGDFLFIDSTHVLSTGSDVCFELFEILTKLPSGVYVHFHDMFWPFEYPRAWAVDENRSWNELYAVRAFLTNNNRWRILFFNDYFAKFERQLIESTYPNFLRNTGGALWLISDFSDDLTDTGRTADWR
jgi:hypothetical protein